MPVTADPTHLLVAVAPIVAVLALLVLRVPSLWAGAVGLSAAVVGAALAFPVSGTVIGETAAGLGPTVVEVALILLGGVGLAQVMTRSGAQDAIADWLDRAEAGADRTVTLLLLVYGLTPFMESVTGFGLGVVITAPLLIRHGLPPVRAVLAGLLGLVLVPWGSMAPGTLIAAELGGVDFGALGVRSALLTPVVLVVSMAVLFATTTGRPGPRQLGLAGLVILVQSGALIGASLLVGPPLSGVVASAAVIAALLGVTRWGNGPLPTVSATLLRAGAPYAVLVAGILLTTALIGAFDADEAAGWLSSPAVWLLVSMFLSPMLLRVPVAGWAPLGIAVLRRWVPVAGNALVFMVLGIVMAATGMAEVLALTAADAGFGFVAAIPAIGALGGYLTGSNTGAAAMFSSATATAAGGLGVDPLLALAGQNVAGSIAIIASPPRIALAVAAALPDGQRLPGPVVRALVGTVVAVAVVLGGLLLVLA